MTAVRGKVAQALTFRHVVYVAGLALSLVVLLVADQKWSSGAGVAFVATAVVWSLEFQTRSIRRAATDRERLLRVLGQVDGVQSEARALGRRLTDQGLALQNLAIVADQGRLASETACVSSPVLATTTAGFERARPHVMFVTSNGSGMGHLTRLMAIARAGAPTFESSFVSLSNAAEVVTRFGFSCVRVASQGQTALSWPEWNRRFAGFMRSHLASVRPDVVVFDGIQVFRGVHESAQGAGIPLVWVARGLWKDSVPRDQVRRWRDVAEVVLVPTERPLMRDEVTLPIADGGLVPVDPVVFLQPQERLTRSEAVERLGLDPGKKHVLIQLGSGALASRAELEREAVEAVRDLGAEWEPVLFRSPLARAAEDVPAGTRIVREYPMVAFLAGFEFSVTSAGYNTVHENLRYAQPAVYVPDRNMLADDQVRRADAVAEAGLGLLAETTEDIASAVTSLSAEERRWAVARRAEEIRVADGAASSAAAIAEVVRTARISAGLEYEIYEPMRTEGK